MQICTPFPLLTFHLIIKVYLSNIFAQFYTNSYKRNLICKKIKCFIKFTNSLSFGEALMEGYN